MIPIMLFGGAFLLFLGAESLVRGASRLAISFGVSALVVGLTIVSIGTSLPEGVTSLTAQLKEDSGDIALANVVGSNIANVGLIVGITALIRPLSFSSHVSKIDMPIMMATLVILLLFMIPGTIYRISGLVLILSLILYVTYRLKTEKTSLEMEELSKIKPNSSSKFKEYGWDIFLIILGGALLIFGGEYFVEGAVQLAKLFNVSDRVIGLTIVAIGTSLPELATTLVAVFRKHSDIAIGNVVGSNIFNSLFIVGAVSLIKPIQFSERLFTIDGPIMILFSALLWVMMWHHHAISRLQALILLVAYGIFITYISIGL